MSPSASTLSLADAVVVTPGPLQGPEARAVAALVEEIEARAHLRLAVAQVLPAGGVPAIVVGQGSAIAARFPDLAPLLPAPAAAKPAEGYSVRADGASGRVVLAGNDARGVLYAVGHLLRKLRIEGRQIELPLPYATTTSPRWPLRGHQLGYRPLANSYPGWDVPMWERYIRELALWGANAIELLPPKTGGNDDCPHLPRPRMEMMVEMSRIVAGYGLDVWVWWPALDGDYAKPEVLAASLKEWGEVAARLPRLDAVFVPGGDPGDTPLEVLFPFLEKQAASLRRHHPKVAMWVSPQGFKGRETEAFFEILRAKQPDWFTGAVLGPWVHMDLAEFRAKVPARYGVRFYPDITHTRHCQYPVPDWDLAYAITLGREPICPRPEGMANILRRGQPHTDGAICYSEGCHDDVNKAVWSALSWDPLADVVDVLRDYARFFVGDRLAEPLAQGLLALERNWQGPLLTNESADATLRSFREMEDAADPRTLKNWRFLQPLFRAYYDAYVRARLVNETALEKRALDALRDPARKGALAAMAEAEEILGRTGSAPVALEGRTRIFQLAEALWQLTHHKLSVRLYRAEHVGRGAHLDAIDWPLNSRLWLKARFAEARREKDEARRRAILEGILGWEDPGPGGFYDSPGTLPMTPRLVRGAGPVEDPAFLRSAMTGYLYLTEPPPAVRYSSLSCAFSLNDAPLRFRYEDLDPRAAYELRVVYGQAEYKARVRCVANGTHEVHGWVEKPDPPAPLTFDVPPAATKSGTLELEWTREPGLGGQGYGCAVAEIWLMRKDR
jgi:hypothetical protein